MLVWYHVSVFVRLLLRMVVVCFLLLYVLELFRMFLVAVGPGLKMKTKHLNNNVVGMHVFLSLSSWLSMGRELVINVACSFNLTQHNGLLLMVV